MRLVKRTRALRIMRATPRDHRDPVPGVIFARNIATGEITKDKRREALWSAVETAKTTRQ